MTCDVCDKPGRRRCLDCSFAVRKLLYEAIDRCHRDLDKLQEDYLAARQRRKALLEEECAYLVQSVRSQLRMPAA